MLEHYAYSIKFSMKDFYERTLTESLFFTGTLQIRPKLDAVNLIALSPVQNDDRDWLLFFSSSISCSKI